MSVNKPLYLKHIYEHVTLGLEFVVRATGLEQGFIDTSTASDNADRRTRGSRDGLLCAAWEADTGFVVVRVADDGGVVAGCTRECATVPDFLLNVADNGTFWQLADREDVANGELGLFAAVDEGAGMQTFGGDECLRAAFVSVRVAEDDAGEGCATVINIGMRFECFKFLTTHRPGSWMMSFTIPRIYPLRSAKSSFRNWAGAFRWWVCALNWRGDRSGKIRC